MKIAFELYFPIVNPVTDEHIWRWATVVMPDLELTAAQVGKLVKDTLELSDSGGIISMLSLAEQLRILADPILISGQWARSDAPSALINWGNWITPCEVDRHITFNYNSRKVGVECIEFLFCGIIQDIDVYNTFVTFIQRSIPQVTQSE